MELMGEKARLTDPVRPGPGLSVEEYAERNTAAVRIAAVEETTAVGRTTADESARAPADTSAADSACWAPNCCAGGT